MVKLVATLGTSPGGVFETYMNLKSGNYGGEPVDIKEVYIIRTSDKAVELAWKLVKAIFVCCGSKEVEIADIPLPINDIVTKEDYEIFRKGLQGKISKGDYVDFTGGRKAMSVAAAINAIRNSAYVVTTIIPQNEYNRIQNLIKQLKEEEIDEAGKGKCVNKEKFCELISKDARTILLT
jgi:CRISPR-associated protein Csx14